RACAQFAASARSRRGTRPPAPPYPQPFWFFWSVWSGLVWSICAGKRVVGEMASVLALAHLAHLALDEKKSAPPAGCSRRDRETRALEIAGGEPPSRRDMLGTGDGAEP